MGKDIARICYNKLFLWKFEDDIKIAADMRYCRTNSYPNQIFAGRELTKFLANQKEQPSLRIW